MKKLATAIAALGLAAAPVGASFGEIILGVKGGIYNPDISGFDPAGNVSAQIGVEFLDLAAVDLAAELEVSQTLADGEVEASGPLGTTASTDYTAQTVGAYISARTIGPIYAIGRVGYARTEIDIDGVGKNDESGASIGAGVGFSLGARTELELTQYDVDGDDVHYLTLGFGF
ncbi:MAG: outer membrane beta-barrel protein [Pseudomonadota bacterium]